MDLIERVKHSTETLFPPYRKFSRSKRQQKRRSRAPPRWIFFRNSKCRRIGIVRRFRKEETKGFRGGYSISSIFVVYQDFFPSWCLLVFVCLWMCLIRILVWIFNIVMSLHKKWMDGYRFSGRCRCSFFVVLMARKSGAEEAMVVNSFMEDLWWSMNEGRSP